MKTVDQIIHGKWVITCENSQVLEDHALIIEKNKILDILPSQDVAAKYTAPFIENFDTHAITPGFINTHMHIGMNFFRGLADDLALMDWLNNHIWPAERAFVAHEFVYDASLIAAAEMIRSGTTCFNEMYFFLSATAQAADKAGLRGHIGITVIDFPTAWAQSKQEYIDKGLEFHHEYKHHELITSTFAPHAIYTVAEDTLTTVRDLAEEHDLKINMHIQETADEINQSISQTQKRPIRRLHDIGFITPRLIAVHMTQINEEDIELLQQGKPQIVHCPESNMKLASGTCPVTILKAAGLNVSLGTDGVASNNDLDMISEMRTASFLAKLSTQNPQALNATETLELATINGAKTLGIDHITGSLKPGKAADFIAIDLDELETQPLYNPISQIVYSSSRHQVTDVWVAGKRLLKNRELLTLDEQELKAKAKFWQKKMANRGGTVC
ncbi:MAG TPA: TRZ/ATZ family hydrolase [Gammaproteobacteria bacterium]|nr:TRZ/ATZ family hydrolase [Gammaproteobacteria bacterium]